MLERISTRQMILIITVTRIATSITNMYIIHIGPANQDIWIMVLLSFFYSILLALPIFFLSTRFSDSTIVGYIGIIFGRVIGKILGILYGILFARVGVLFFYTAIQMIRSAFMTELAPLISIFVLTVLCLYAATRGLEVLGRTAEVYSPIIIGSLIIFTILGLNKVDMGQLLPILGDSSLTSINLGALQMSIYFTDIYILAMNMPQLENKKDFKRIFIVFNLFSILIILMMVVVVQTSLGIEQARHAVYPFLTYVRMVRAYSIFQRIESIFLVVWMLIITARIVAYIYISSYVFKEVFNRKNVNTFIYPMGIITAVITYYHADINPRIVDILVPKPIEYIIYFTFKVVIPLLAILIYFLRRNRLKSQERLPN